MVRTDQSILFSSVSFASFQLCCVLRDLDPILHMVLKQYADDNEVTEVKISLDLTRSRRNERHGSFSHLETLWNSFTNSNNAQRIQQSDLEHTSAIIAKHGSIDLTFSIFEFCSKCKFLDGEKCGRKRFYDLSSSSRHSFYSRKTQINQRLICFSVFYNALVIYSMAVSATILLSDRSIDRSSPNDSDLQWLKNHVDIVEDFANFLIQVNRFARRWIPFVHPSIRSGD